MANPSPSSPADTSRPHPGDTDSRYEAIEQYIRDVVVSRHAIAASEFQRALMNGGIADHFEQTLPSPERERELRVAAFNATSQLAGSLVSTAETDKPLVAQMAELALYIDQNAAFLPKHLDLADFWTQLRIRHQAHLLANDLIRTTRQGGASAPAKLKKKKGRPPADPDKRLMDVQLFRDWRASPLPTMRLFLEERYIPLDVGLAQIERGRKAVERAGQNSGQ